MMKRVAAAVAALLAQTFVASADNVVIYPTRAVVILGQSQGTNILGPTKYTIRNSSVLQQINVANGAVSAASEPFLGVTGSNSTFFAEMADLMADTGRWARIVLAPISVDGTYAAEWAPGGSSHSRITSILSQLSAVNVKIGAVIWMQGEADAYGTTTTASYKASVIAALSAFRNAGVRAPFFVAKETWIYGDLPTNATAIRTAQGELPNPDMQIFAGPDLDSLGNGYRNSGDSTHFNDAGKAAVAGLWVPYLLQRMR